MTTIDLLQQVGLTKYEAEAYYTLLREGELTGYELGKRSAVPLPRSYDVLERLSRKGLALVQPGEPPRYRAEEPAHLLEQIRGEVTATLDALNRELSTLPRPNVAEGFWVLRGRQAILSRCRAMVESARRSVALAVSPGDDLEELVSLAEAHRDRAVSVTVVAVPDVLLLLVDRQEALVGTIVPEGQSQVVVSGNPALLHLVEAYVDRGQAARRAASALWPPTPVQPDSGSWLAWDEDKHRRLLQFDRGRGVA